MGRAAGVEKNTCQPSGGSCGLLRHMRIAPDGMLDIPPDPGLRIELNDDALTRFRVA